MKQNRTFSMLAVLLVACSVLGSAQSLAAKRPNILFVISDDQSWLHTSAFGDKVVKTPAFDRIANEGVLFTHSYVAAPSCSPSRVAVLAGQDMWRLKQGGLLHSSIAADTKMYTHLLEDAGYHVGMTGKGYAPGKWDYLGLKRRPAGKAYDDNKEVLLAEELTPLNYSKNFEDFLEDKEEGQPFAFWFGAYEPHRFYQKGAGQKEGLLKVGDVDVPSFLPDTDEIRQDMLDYYYEIEWYDTYLEGMIDKLEAMGELENTLIIVTSDNGMPLPRAKTTLYDWGSRVPLAVRFGKNVKNPGRWVTDFVSHTDFAPTILDAAGVDIPEEMTGRSILPLLKSKKAGRVDKSRDHVVYGLERHTYSRPDGQTYPSRAIRTDDFLYIRNYEPDRWPAGNPDFLSSNKTVYGDIDPGASRDFLFTEEFQTRFPEQAKLILGKRPGEELYKVSDDPGQIHNLAGQKKYAGIQKKLAAKMTKRLKETQDPRIEGRDPWQDYVYHQYYRYGVTFNKVLPKSERRRAKLLPGYYKNVPKE